MKNSGKAALLSALVLPGTGHLYLKHYRRAVVLMLIAVSALSIIVVRAVRQARMIADKILSGEIAPDPAAIAAQIDAAGSATDSTQVGIAYWALIVCWLIGIADAYRLGTLHDKKLRDKK